MMDKESLKALVGDQTYATWVEMLRRLVPNGRTHRLATVIAGMLQYALTRAYDHYKSKPPPGSIADTLISISENMDFDSAPKKLGNVLRPLFADAKVAHSRTNARGQKYDIIDSVVEEFLNWENMPWE